MNIFIDTGAFYALADTSDAHHNAAKDFYITALEEHRFFTTTFVLVETWLLVRNKLGYRAAQKFLETIRKGVISLLEVLPSDLENAWTILAEYADQQFSLVDATSFIVMDRLQMQTAFCFDAHFRVYRLDGKKEIHVLP